LDLYIGNSKAIPHRGSHQKDFTVSGLAAESYKIEYSFQNAAINSDIYLFKDQT
jgi:hypothetical protein